MICLSKRQILFLHEELIWETGGSPGLQDEALLDSALAAPFQTFDGPATLSIPPAEGRLSLLWTGYGSPISGRKQANRSSCHAGILGSQWDRT